MLQKEDTSQDTEDQWHTIRNSEQLLKGLYRYLSEEQGAGDESQEQWPTADELVDMLLIINQDKWLSGVELEEQWLATNKLVEQGLSSDELEEVEEEEDANENVEEEVINEYAEEEEEDEEDISKNAEVEKRKRRKEMRQISAKRMRRKKRRI